MAMVSMTAVAIVVAAALLIGMALNRAARWAGERGWVYNKHNPRPPGRGSLMLVEQIYQPSIEHVVEEQSAERLRAEESESGQDRDPGGPSA